MKRTVSSARSSSRALRGACSTEKARVPCSTSCRSSAAYCIVGATRTARRGRLACGRRGGPPEFRTRSGGGQRAASLGAADRRAGAQDWPASAGSGFFNRGLQVCKGVTPEEHRHWRDSIYGERRGYSCRRCHRPSRKSALASVQVPNLAAI